LLKGELHVNGWYIGFGWKVHRIVHGKRCMAFFYIPVDIRKAKRKAFLVLGFRTWTVEYLATQKVTRTVLPPNMDSSSFARHHAQMTTRA